MRFVGVYVLLAFVDRFSKNWSQTGKLLNYKWFLRFFGSFSHFALLRVFLLKLYGSTFVWVAFYARSHKELFQVLLIPAVFCMLAFLGFLGFYQLRVGHASWVILYVCE